MSETKVVHEVKLSKPVFVIAALFSVGVFLGGVSAFAPKPAWAELEYGDRIKVEIENWPRNVEVSCLSGCN